MSGSQMSYQLAKKWLDKERGSFSSGGEVKVDAAVLLLEPATEAKRHKVHAAVECIQKFPRALLEVARVAEWGDRKHNQPLGSKFYLEVPDADTTYLDAEARHMIAEVIEGPINAEDDGMLHKAQKAWSALADLEVFLRNREEETTDA